MAQEGGGPPRKTSPFLKFTGMASRNERYNTKNDELFWLENIMRVGPRKLHSIPGPGPDISLFGIPSNDLPPPQINNDCVEFDSADQILTQQNNCGFFINLCAPAVYVGVDLTGNAYTQVKYLDNATGTAKSGPAISIAADANRPQFTGYAAIYNSTAHTITLGKWILESLETIPTTLGTPYSVTLVSGDVLKLSKNDTTHVLTVKVNGSTVITATDNTIPFSNPGFGVAGVGSDDVSQDWGEFTVSCAEYVGSGGGGHSETDACCVGAPGGLSIACCGGPCEFSCDVTAAGTPITLKACGGTPPYTWGSTGTSSDIIAVAAGDTSVVQIANFRRIVASVSFGVVILPRTFQCCDTPGDSGFGPPPHPAVQASNCRPAYGWESLGIFQHQWDCAGHYLGWSACSVDSYTQFSCAENANISNYSYSLSKVSEGPCYLFGIGFQEGARAINLSVGGAGGGSATLQPPCIGRHDPGCYPPTLEYVDYPPCECYDLGGTIPTGQPFTYHWYNLTGRIPVSSPIDSVSVTVTDSLGATVNMIIDVV